MIEDTIDEELRRSRLPRREPRPYQGVRWKSLADTHQWQRRQPEPLGSVQRIVGEIPS
jgi:hypothetical protein